LLGEGLERVETRDRSANIVPLLRAIQRHLDDNRQLMESLCDTSVLLLASEKLDLAKARHRSQLADELVGRYAKRAVIGALAAVAPGVRLADPGCARHSADS
jgi:hypothetical protein